jgi:hypothetical protein
MAKAKLLLLNTRFKNGPEEFYQTLELEVTIRVLNGNVIIDCRNKKLTLSNYFHSKKSLLFPRKFSKRTSLVARFNISL